MPQQGLRLEDIIRSQERMAGQGDKAAAATIQRLQEMERTLKAEHAISKQDRLLQVAQTYEAYKADKDDDRIADATEKTAEEIEKVNKNVVKLTQTIKGAVGGKAAVSTPGVQIDTSRAQGFFEKYKQLGSLKGWFETTGPSKGMLDDIIRRRVAKGEYVETQQQVAGSSKELATRRYQYTDKLKKQAENIKSQIQVYKNQGLSEEQIQGTSAYQRLQNVEGKIAAADPLVRERVAGTLAAAAGATKESFQAPLVATNEAKLDLLGGTEEQQMEQQRMWQEQLNVLLKIEENTRVFAAVAEKIDKLGAKLGEAGAAPAEGGGGIDIMLPPSGKGGKPTPKPKVGGRFGKMMKGVRGAPGIGAALAVGAGAYEAYTGWTEASAEEEQELAQIEQLEQSGQITPEQAAAAKQEVVDVTDVKQAEAVGGGVGTAAGAVLGMKAGATLGTFVGGPVGTVVGGAIGGVVGAVAGSSVGQDIARWGAKGWQATRDFFGGKKKELPVEPTPKASFFQLRGENETINARISEADFAKNDPEGFELYKKFNDEQTEIIYKQIREQQKKDFGKNADQPGLEQEARAVAKSTAKEQAVLKFRKQIEAANAGYVKISSANGQPTDTSTLQADTTQPSTEHIARGVVEPMSADDMEDVVPIRIDGQEVGTMGPEGIVAKPGQEQALRAAQAQARQMATPSTAASATAAPATAATVTAVPVEDENLEDTVPIRVDGKQVGTMGPEGIVAQPGQEQVLKAAQAQAREIATPGTAVPATPAVGDMVYTRSEENAAAAATPPAAPSAPVVINAPTNVQQTSNYGTKSPPRNTESSYQQYNRARYSF